MKRKPKSSSFNSDRDYDRYERLDREAEYAAQDSAAQRKPQKSTLSSALSTTSLFILAGVFVLGIGIGIAFASFGNSGDPGKIVTVSELESKAPNPEFCVQYGASAITMDTRVFVTLNPLNVYVSQPTTRPGCVIRSSNFAVLEQRGLIKSDQMRDCRQRLNTFGYTGTLENSPQIDCVYQNDAAKNLFLNQPGSGGGAPAPENEKF